MLQTFGADFLCSAYLNFDQLSLLENLRGTIMLRRGAYTEIVACSLIPVLAIFPIRDIIMPPTLKKLKGHIALGLSVRLCVRPSFHPLQIKDMV